MESLPSEQSVRPDGELLRRYLDCRDDVALTELITRHAALVRGVCRRVLGNSPDADDAFQATFLVLVRSGGRILRPQSLAAWLFGVAHRISKRQRRQRGLPAQSVREDQVMIEHDPLAELAARYDISLFDAELARLPEKYRAPIVLHHLEGKSQREVAAELQLTEGAVDGLLKRGRNELRLRLARQGVVFGVTLAAVQSAQNAVAALPPHSLIETTVQGMLLHDPMLHAEPINTPVARLAHQEMSTMALFQVTRVTAWTLVGSLFLGAAGVGVSTARHHPSTNQAAVIASELAVAKSDAQPQANLEAATSVEPTDEAQPNPEPSIAENLADKIEFNAAKAPADIAGIILDVDQKNKTVQLSISIDDGVRNGMRFQISTGTGDERKSKATLEVIRVDADTSTARIVEEDSQNPIAQGDRVDSPQPPRSHAGEKIALVGDIDLDGDGKSDREMFHKLLREAGIKISGEVDDAGDRTGDKLSEGTKFLVVGSIPAVPGGRRNPEFERVAKAMDHLKDLRKEASLSGVRMVSLNDFLDYIGQPKANPVPDPEKPRPKDFRQRPASEVRIEAALHEQTEISFVETSLKDSLDFIKDLHNIPVIIREAEITEDGGSADQRVNIEFSGGKLESALDLMLQPLGLDYLIDKEVLLITTTTKAAEHRELRVYNLDDFLPMFDNVPLKDEKITERMVSAIQKAVGGTWDPEKPSGTMSLTGAGLVVRTNQRTHREIENLIEQLRRAEEAK